MRKTNSVLWVKVVWAALVPSGQNICTLSLSAKRNTKISNIEFFCVCFHYYRQPKDTTLKSCFELEQFGKRTPASSVPGPDSHLHNSLLSQSNLSISAAMLQYFIKVRRVSVLWENMWIGYSLRTLLPLRKLPISVFHAWGGEGPVNNDKEGKWPMI